MGLFDRIGRGFESFGGFLGDVAGSAVESFSQEGFQDPRGGGFGGFLGSLLGDVGQAARTVLLPTRTPVAQGGQGAGRGGVVVTPTVPGRLPGLSQDVLDRLRAQVSGGGIIQDPRDLARRRAQVEAQRGPPVSSTVTGRTFIPGSPGTSGDIPFISLDLPDPRGETQMAGLALALPGGAAIARGLGRGLGALGIAGGLEQLFGGGNGMDEVGFFQATMGGVRVKSTVMLRHPISGQPVFFKHAGRPILFSGDLRTCKRVNKIAARARRSRGR